MWIFLKDEEELRAISSPPHKRDRDYYIIDYPGNLSSNLTAILNASIIEASMKVTTVDVTTIASIEKHPVSQVGLTSDNNFPRY